MTIFAIAFLLSLQVKAEAAKPKPSQLQREARLSHAKELLGGTYKRSVVRQGEDVRKINGFVYRWTRDSLPAKFHKKYQKVAQTVIDESLKHGFDPVFLLAIIQSESSFNPLARGSLDEIGLMQLRPDTARWIAEREGIKWHGKRTLRDPISNIKIGAAFLAYLRERFDSHAQLYLAAYNMGQGNVRTKVKSHIWPKEYPVRVMQAYVDYYRELKEAKSKTEPREERGIAVSANDRAP